MRFKSPKDYGKNERKYGPPIGVTSGFRLAIPMDQKLRKYARANCTDISVVIRHAMNEYLQKRGLNAFQSLGIN